MARSDDGLSFRREPGFRIPRGGIPGAIAVDSNTVRVYMTGRGGITSALYDLRTARLEPDPGARIPGPAADPSPWRRGDGSYVMIFKRWMNRPRPSPNRPKTVHSSPSGRVRS